MSKKVVNKLLGILVVAVLIVSSLQTASAQSDTGTGTGGNPVQADAQPVSAGVARPAVNADLDPNKSVRVIVQLSDPSSASYRGGVEGFEPTSPKVTGSKGLDVASPNVASYEKYLRDKQAAFINSVRAAVPQASAQRSYQTVLNGVVIKLPAGKVDLLRRMDGVVNVSYEQERKLQMDSSLGLIGLGTGTVGGAWTDSGLWQTVGGHINAGKGVKIADIDSGITPSNPCFAPAGFTMPAGYPKGETAITNAKIIVARSYFRADDLPVNPATALDDPAVDGGGHGTHTAGTIACNYGTTTTFSGIKISGVAPAAQLLVYRVFYLSQSGSESAWTPELVAAIEDAVRDGAQVVNNSWGGTNVNAVDSLETIAYESAVDAGVVIVFSAGNSGPGSMTVGGPGGNSEKFITVAASTTARTFTTTLENTARSDAGTLLSPAITGRSLTQSAVTAPIVDLEVMGYTPTQALACSPLAAGSVTGKIVVVRRGTCNLVDKAVSVQAGGGVGVVIRNVPGGSSTLPLIVPVLPTVHIALTDGEALKAYLAALPGGTTATFRINGPSVVAPAGDVADTLASFSSRGPTPDLKLKPDISAPGVNTLSAVSPAQIGSTTASFDFYQGTSMAAPHVTGAAALLRQIYPQWTPAQIRSALMTTASEPVELGNNPAERGAGRLNLSAPDKVTLTFDHPSLSFQLAQIGLAKTITVMASNMTGQNVTYQVAPVHTTAAATVQIQVDGLVANQLTVPANGSKAFNVVLTGVTAGDAYGKVSFSEFVAPGSVNLPPAELLHLPYYARVTAASTLADVYLVDGDSSPAVGCTDYSALYKSALTAAGFTYSEATINYTTGAGFDFYQARLHKWVLYFDGDPRCGGWLSSEGGTLRNYMAQGGKMLVMGQDVAYWDRFIAVNYGVSFYPDFYVGANFVQDNLFNGASDYHAAADVNYNPFLGGMVIPLDPANSISVDELGASMYPDMDTVPLFMNQNVPGAIGGTNTGVLGTRASSEPTIERVQMTKAWTPVPFRSLFTAFGLENILEGPGTTYRADLLLKADEWLMDELTIVFPSSSFATVHPGVAVQVEANATSSSGGAILSYRVDYGDGTPIETITAASLSKAHQYAKWGDYVATVEAMDEYGRKAVKSIPVHVGSVYYLPLIKK